jgi:hypothetical protein
VRERGREGVREREEATSSMGFPPNWAMWRKTLALQPKGTCDMSVNMRASRVCA